MSLTLPLPLGAVSSSQSHSSSPAVTPIVPPLLMFTPASPFPPSSSSSSASSSSLSLSLHTSTAPLPHISSQPMPYDQLLTRYQQACADRDALSTQVKELKDTNSRSLLSSSATMSSSLSSLTLSPLSPSSTSSFTTKLSSSLSPRSLSPLPSSPSLPSSSNSTSLQFLRDQHSTIQTSLSDLQHRTARILHDQERELIRAFRLRLSEVTAELNEERKRSESGSAEWVQRCRRLSEELEWLKELTERLTTENKDRGKELKRAKQQIKVQEEDREFLIQQLVAAKKENARMRQRLDKAAGGKQQQAQDQWLVAAKEEKVAMT